MRTLSLYIKKYFSEIVVVLLTIPALLPLFHPGFFTMHDDQQVARLYELDRAFAAGQFPARWVKDLGFGYGYPLFIFYPPLVYYLGEIFHLLFGTTFILSTKFVFGFAFLGAGLAMYFWSKEHFGKIGGIIAAAFYTYVPYHAVDAYVRGSLAELTAFVWLPLILWSTDRLIIKQEKKQWLWLSLWLALLMLTHNLIFLPFMVLFPFYVLFLLVKSRSKLYALRSTLYAVLLALSLSAFFWLPALIEKKFTLVDSILLSELANYKLHFVYPNQLWNSLWGYGGSTAGPLDGISFKIGKLHVVLAFLVPVLWFVVQRYKRTKMSLHLSLYSFNLLVLFLISAFMTTQFSEVIWKVVRPLQYLQFPWRFLTFTALFASFLAGSVIAAVYTLKSHLATGMIAIMLLALLLYPNLKLFKPQTYLQVSDSHYVSDEFLKWKISKTSFEFVPEGVKTRKELSEAEKREITQVDINRDQIPTQPLSVISGIGEIETKRNVPGNLKLQTKSNETMKIRLNTFDFPGWEVRIDGQRVNHTSDNELRLITVTIPPGEHRLDAGFKNTQIRTFANLVTLLGILVVLGIQMKWNQRMKKE
ncbi:MAG: hypothetical protein A2900_03120 [Candidatus Chisholmbacteria bacterium RIFCSPLOWO2_01_FULL_50_28]|uniref:Membrane protein 6-pyruvoyl-tetrahydropterin synthase-related domain-containing protein n=1 Tax=Candidatus Chisholmbacteria bacterium RIFCSPHIGHO2_01_FULL_52_32 TaxID=1797591 RepID=A0A1G1VT44_9BACT|nr:MAG: hypothetical protein A2786_03625 [Candidatus Chisholmbacteria bacterium RIFCSPHIGHO2_01_FULL_52_32]OGY20067.1 MAG: hypothetical protein A2900_03120 [Candidatus Chisholmbacteria bacterium RIFCSPLOWO2_01_FULL_50_28]